MREGILLCSGMTKPVSSSGVLAQEGHRTIGASPEEGHHDG